MLTSKDVPDMIGKSLLVTKTGLIWTITGAKVVRWAGLVADLSKGSDKTRITVHNAVWDSERGMYVL